MSPFAIILILLVVGAAVIAVYSATKPSNILWIAVLLLAIGVALMWGGEAAGIHIR
jgi:hypothetical protein